MRIDMEFPSSSEPCSERVKYNVEQQSRNYTPTSSHVLFCLLNKCAHDDLSDDVPKISEHSPKIL